MTRNAARAGFIAMALASGVSPASALTTYAGRSTFDAATGESPYLGVSSLSEISKSGLTWAGEGDADIYTGDLAFGAPPSPAARTDGWALVPEPAAWTFLVMGLGVAGATLRARHGLL